VARVDRDAPDRLPPRRPRAALIGAAARALNGAPLLLDTTVYIDELQGRLPGSVEAVLLNGDLRHSTVCVGEIALAIGHLAQSDPRSAARRATLLGLLDRLPPEWVSAPSPQDWARAGVLAGQLARLAGVKDSEGRRRLLNDALIAASAERQGLAVLTRNWADFDRLQQRLPALHVAFYDR
jgi:predicted nucleic acid-binding protein